MTTTRTPDDRRQDTDSAGYLAEHISDRRNLVRREQDVRALMLAAGDHVGRGTNTDKPCAECEGVGERRNLLGSMTECGFCCGMGVER